MFKSTRTAALLCLLCSATLNTVAVTPAAGQNGADPKTDDSQPQRYTTRRIHDPNGIGKFYMGREIAHVMGFAGARWLERESREKEERLTLLVKSLKLRPDMTVADIGAGSGVISMLIARQLGDGGQVLAVDIQDKMLERLKTRCRAAGIDNVKPVKGTIKSPNLKPGSVDLIVMVDVYHEFSFPYEMTLQLARSLKPGGRIAWVEYRGEDRSVPIKLVHKMTEAQVKIEASQPEFGLRFVETIDVLPWQHIVLFERPKQPPRAAEQSADNTD